MQRTLFPSQEENKIEASVSIRKIASLRLYATEARDVLLRVQLGPVRKADAQVRDWNVHSRLHAPRVQHRPSGHSTDRHVLPGLWRKGKASYSYVYSR